MRWPWRRGDAARQFDNLWGDLARYNAEVARGIVHTDEWKELMRRKQAVVASQLPPRVTKLVYRGASADFRYPADDEER